MLATSRTWSKGFPRHCDWEDEYMETLACICYDVYDAQYSYIVWGGNFNVDFKWKHPLRDTICRIMDDLSLSNVNKCKKNFRFISERELKFRFAICRRPSVCRLSSVICLSVVCDVRAPYSADWNFRQCFYAIWYLGHPWPLCKNFTKIVQGEPLRRGVKPKRGSKI